MASVSMGTSIMAVNIPALVLSIVVGVQAVVIALLFWRNYRLAKPTGAGKRASLCSTNPATSEWVDAAYIDVHGDPVLHLGSARTLVPADARGSVEKV